MGLDAIVHELTHNLAAVATPERAEHEKGYLKSELEHLGATVPDARREAKRLAAAYPELLADPWPLVEACWATGIYELRSTMGFFLERADVDDVDALERVLRDCHTWALIDQLAVHVVPRAKPSNSRLRKWARDDDFWIRRTALLADLKRLRAGKGDLTLWASLAAPNLSDAEPFIQKAIGWVLREIAKKRPDWTAQYVAAHAAQLSALSLREATRNIPSEHVQR